jgi:hypothetical protein
MKALPKFDSILRALYDDGYLDAFIRLVRNPIQITTHKY